MLKLLSVLPLAQVLAPSVPLDLPYSAQVVEPQEVRSLPGQLDNTPVFNSNSPEVVQSDGILLSTFPTTGMRTPAAHLNYAFRGRFDIFAHHIARGLDPDDVRTMFLGILVYNPSEQPVTLQVQQAVSYLSQEAPFHNLPSYVANPMGSVFAGPGSRTMNDILRGLTQSIWPPRVTIRPGHTYMLLNAPIPLRNIEALRNGIPLPQFLEQMQQEAESNVDSGSLGNGTVTPPPPRPTRNFIPINGRTVLMYANASGPVHVASLGMYGRLNPNGSERPPTLQEWVDLLRNGELAGPRDRPPTPPNTRSYRRFYYGRVAGVSQGSQWVARLTDPPNGDRLTLPARGQRISYVISTVDNNTFGTAQIQSAPMLVRYPDTAYRAHGNYAVHYKLSLPLYNASSTSQAVAILFQTPLQDESLQGRALRFLNPPERQVFFRGTIRIRYPNDFGRTETRYLHIIHRRGQQGQPLIRLTMPPGDRRLVEVDFLYPPDATPPQVLTVQTLDDLNLLEANTRPGSARSSTP
ncbi:MAG TPA: DUF3370 domain-containing protein [Synechococcales cyanobacterium M55_K2018_004]|nr:DUF3370 domain-containing protein [Synechococcales cyanobacterium M55_K2018_004]